MNSPFVCLAVSISVVALGCSTAVRPVAQNLAPVNPPSTGLPTTSSRVRLAELSGATPAPMETAPGLTYSAESSDLYIHTTDRNTVEGRIKIAVIRGDTETETTERLRSIDHLEKALRGTGIVNVDISTGRAQPFDAISTDAPLLIAGSGPRGARRERYARELAKYAGRGGLIIGAAPHSFSQQGAWRQVPDDHPLLNSPYRIETSRRNDRTAMLVVNGRVVGISARYDMASGFRLTGDAAKRWMACRSPARARQMALRTLTTTRRLSRRVTWTPLAPHPRYGDSTHIHPPRLRRALPPRERRDGPRGRGDRRARSRTWTWRRLDIARCVGYSRGGDRHAAYPLRR